VSFLDFDPSAWVAGIDVSGLSFDEASGMSDLPSLEEQELLDKPPPLLPRYHEILDSDSEEDLLPALVARQKKEAPTHPTNDDDSLDSLPKLLVPNNNNDSSSDGGDGRPTNRRSKQPRSSRKKHKQQRKQPFARRPQPAAAKPKPRPPTFVKPVLVEEASDDEDEFKDMPELLKPGDDDSSVESKECWMKPCKNKKSEKNEVEPTSERVKITQGNLVTAQDRANFGSKNANTVAEPVAICESTEVAHQSHQSPAEQRPDDLVHVVGPSFPEPRPTPRRIGSTRHTASPTPN
jgi:hypothetical protein